MQKGGERIALIIEWLRREREACSWLSGWGGRDRHDDG